MWNGLTTPREPKASYVPEPVECDGCGAEIEAGEEHACLYRGCQRELCDGCSHECVLCQCLFCQEHIVTVAMGQICVDCARAAAAAAQLKKEAA